MFIELSTDEIIRLLENGSTNQQVFIQNIDNSNNDVYDVIDTITEEMENTDLFDFRGWLNGGVIAFDLLTEDIRENHYFIEFENNYGVVFY